MAGGGVWGGERVNEDVDMVKRVAAQLGEHYDSVQIFATRSESGQGGTVHAEYGVGNWYARFGQVREWLSTQEEVAKESVRKGDET